MLEKKYDIKFNDRDIIDTSKYDNISLNELDKLMKKEKKNIKNILKKKTSRTCFLFCISFNALSL